MAALHQHGSEAIFRHSCLLSGRRARSTNTRSRRADAASREPRPTTGSLSERDHEIVLFDRDRDDLGYVWALGERRSVLACARQAGRDCPAVLHLDGEWSRPGPLGIEIGLSRLE